MSLRRQLAELLVLRCSGHLLDQQRRYPQWEASNAELQHWLAEGVGGVILLGGSAAELALRCRQLQQWASTPLLLCADVEEGVGQRFEGASWLVPPLALGGVHQRNPAEAIELARAYGRCSGMEAHALGLNWVLGPVCDVNNNPANPVINEMLAALAGMNSNATTSKILKTKCCIDYIDRTKEEVPNAIAFISTNPSSLLSAAAKV